VGVGGDVLKLFKKTLSVNGSLLSLITEEEKQDVDSGCGFNSLIYRETRTDAGKALNM
jgi:hypothetical protein